MEKVKVVHSQSKPAFNIVSVKFGAKYKIARIPYVICGYNEIDTREKKQAENHANLIAKHFNNGDIPL